MSELLQDSLHMSPYEELNNGTFLIVIDRHRRALFTLQYPFRHAVHCD
ncbi:hypothetical protein HZV92_003148 [Salmonella enterica]|nr:hypothetical protein [Salmonella enterica]